MKRLIIPAAIVILIVAVMYSRPQKSANRTEAPAEQMPSMQARLDEMKTAFEKQAPPGMVNALAQGLREVAASGILDKALKEGNTAPDFELPDASGRMVKLYDLLAGGPVILTWYRGGW